MKKKLFLLIGFILLFGISLFFYFFSKEKKEIFNEYSLFSKNNYSFLSIHSEEELQDQFSSIQYSLISPLNNEERKKAFENGKQILYFTTRISENEIIEFDTFEINQETLKLYLKNHSSCGVFPPKEVTFEFIIDSQKEFKELEVYLKNTQDKCNQNINYKPIIYIYPEEDTDLTIQLKDTEKLLYTYPKYKNSWNIKALKNGSIYDYKTKRNYYALYYEAIDNTTIDTTKGFVIKGSETISFLEEKLAYLGLNEREINEFIIYWIDKLEKNNYNYIYFRTTDEVNQYMELSSSKPVDTLIRVFMDYAPLEKRLEVSEQKLTPIKRRGFTIVEWGGRKINIS